MQRLAIASLITLTLNLGAGLTPAQAGCGLEADPAKLDQDWNAELSHEEVRGSSLEPVFDRVDRNGDGVIGQPEFAARCSAMTEDGGGSRAERPPAAAQLVGDKARRQARRQRSRTESRLDRETDRAVDSALDRAVNSLFD